MIIILFYFNIVYIRGDFVILLNAACYSVINFLSPKLQVVDYIKSISDGKVSTSNKLLNYSLGNYFFYLYFYYDY